MKLVLHQISLKSLYTFSKAAQHLNFTTTAEELNITPSAISHQIKRLEDSLGCKLFITEGKQLKLTPEAYKYSLAIAQSFSQLQNATKEFIDYDRHIIQLGVSSAFAVKRLTPELGLWQNDFPDIDLRLRMNTSKDDVVNFNLDAILSAKVDDNKYISEFICDEHYYPVCSKSFFQKIKNDDLHSALLNATLIDIEGVNCWKDWFNWKQFEATKQVKVIFYSHTLLMLQAVISGQGIALIDKLLIKDEINSGELVLLDKTPYLHPGQSYYFSYLKKRSNDASIVKLKKWLLTLF